MDRRAFIGSLVGGLLATPLAAQAQPAGKVPRIGALVVASPGFAPIEGFRQGLRELGYVEGRNIAVEYRYAAGRTDRYGDLAAEVVRLKPDVIVVWGTELTQMVRRAPRRFRSFSRSRTGRSRWGWSPTSRGQVGMSRASRR